MRSIVCVVLAFVVGCGAKTPVGKADKAPDSVATADKTNDGYPYPECRAFHDAMKKAIGDPSSLEIIDWGKLNEANEYGTRTALVKFRGKNEAGALQTQQLYMFIRTDGVVGAQPHGWTKGDPINPSNL